MYKHIALLARKPELSHEAFLEHWRETHAPIARQIDGVVRYHRVIPTEPAHAEFDGIAELYFEELDALYDALGRPGSRDYDPTEGAAKKARADVDNFLSIEDRPRFIGEEIVQKDMVDGETDGLYKHAAFLVRKPGMSHEEFVDHWQGTHTPIARDIDGVVRYVTVLPAEPEHAEFDGVAELYFEELDALYDALGSEGSRDYDPAAGNAKRAREDVDNFLAIEDRPRLIGREHVVPQEQ
ncbi:MAG: EthD family reductase [Halobacteriota archaeon]